MTSFLPSRRGHGSETGVVGKHVVVGIGTAHLPEHLAIEVDGGEAGDLVKGVPVRLANVLREQHVDLPIAIQVAEAGVAGGAVAGVLKRFQSFGCGLAARSLASSASRLAWRL